VAPTIRLGVTGLAGAGKTVFITALIRNLTASGRLPFFKAVAEGRIIAAYLEPQPDDDIPRFDYERHIASLLQQPPSWPESTRRISQLRLTVEYLPANALWRNLGPQKLHIDIMDYPGEWLADLQMLEQSYQQWSAAQMLLARTPFRAKAAGGWLEHAQTIDPAATQDETTARVAAEIFTSYLDAARRTGASLGTLGPGRFMMPGDLESSPMLTFVPLDIEPEAPIAPATTAAMMARRYESYKAKVVKPFFRNHFARIDRQIVIVDALAALNHGPEAIEQLTNALEISLRAFRPGARSWLSRILDRRIDRILYAAAKADHLPHTSHDRLEAALRLVIGTAAERAATAGGDVRVMALAAIRATRELKTMDANEELFCVQGTPLPGETLDGRTFDGDKEVVVFPGDLPADPAEAVRQRTGPLDVRFVRFRPPPLSDPLGTEITGKPWPHIRLDRALEFLFGDYLR
jgi:predicted YcjX-like family ATPase